MGSIVGYCEVCNKQFVKYRSFQKYCCDECRLMAHEKEYGYKKKEDEKKKCKNCGKMFTTNNSKKVYCSVGCYATYQEHYHKHTDKETRECMQCGDIFETSHPTKKYCSGECYTIAKKLRELRN